MTFANRKFIGLLGAATVVIIAEYILVPSDGVIAGQMIGEKALGAVNMLMPIFMVALARRGIFIDRMVADVVSGDGRKFCRLFGFEKVGESDHDSLIYEILTMPPRIRMNTDTIQRLRSVYAEKC